MPGRKKRAGIILFFSLAKIYYSLNRYKWQVFSEHNLYFCLIHVIKAH